MSRFFPLLALILILGACSSQPETTKIEEPIVDSVPLQRVNTEGELKAYALAILADSIEPGDNALSLQCLDSLLANDVETRAFYFEVYLVMANKADGALAELVTSIGIDYLTKYPAEMLANYKEASDDDKALIADNLAFEFYASGGNITEEVAEYFKKVTKGLDAANLQIATALKKAIISRAKEMRTAESVV